MTLRPPNGAGGLMAHREVTLLEVKEVLRLWLSGIPKKRVAALLGYDPKTVRRYLKAARELGLPSERGPGGIDDALVAAVVAQVRPVMGRSHGEGWERCHDKRAFIEDLLDRRIRLTKIGKLLARQGVAISYPTLRRFAMAELGFGQGARTI